MNRFLFDRFVEHDLRAIRDHIAKDSPEAAIRQMERLVAAFRRLAANPKIGHKRDDLIQGLRFWPVGSYLIAYRAERRPIEIVAVVHGARNIPALLNFRL